MNTIEYRTPKRYVYRLVYLDGKHIGEVHMLDNGAFQYWPRGTNAKPGEAFLKFSDLARSLETP